MPRKIRKLLLALVVIVVLAMVAVLVLSTGRTLPRPPLPNPNGYDNFLKAAALLASDVGNAPTLGHDGLRALLSTNSESLRLLRVGLTHQCAMPMDSALTNFAGMMPQLANMKRLVQLLAAEGRVGEMENRPADAARSYTDAIVFGNEMSRGGLLITRLVGVACEAIGETPLAKMVPKLSYEQARVVLTELEKVDADRVTWADVLRNEGQFSRYQIRHRFNPIVQVMGWWQNRQAIQKAEMRHKRIVAHERLLAAELALRCCQSEQGRAPTRLDLLVPKYLQRVPLDPFSGKAMIYRPQGTNWLVYSVGPDGVDDGGKRIGSSFSGAATKGDMLYDSPY